MRGIDVPSDDHPSHTAPSQPRIEEPLPVYAASTDLEMTATTVPVLSPLGALSGDNPATFGQLNSLKLKNTAVMRTAYLAWDPVTYIPTTVYNDDSTAKLFDVLMPAFVGAEGTVDADFFPYYGLHDIPHTNEKPHIIVKTAGSDHTTASEALAAQLFLKNWTAKIFHQQSGTRASRNFPYLSLTLSQNIVILSFQSSSSKGLLRWRWPGSACMSSASPWLVCTDVYERPVAAYYSTYPERVVKDPEPRQPIPPRREPPEPEGGQFMPTRREKLLFYTDVGEELFKEILMTFIVMSAQISRFNTYQRKWRADHPEVGLW